MTVRDDIRDFVMNAFYAPLRLSDDASLLDEGITDGAGLIEVIAFIEENFGIEVHEGEVTEANFDSIGKISAYVESKLNEADTVPASGRRTLPNVGVEASGPASAAG